MQPVFDFSSSSTSDMAEEESSSSSSEGEPVTMEETMRLYERHDLPQLLLRVQQALTPAEKLKALEGLASLIHSYSFTLRHPELLEEIHCIYKGKLHTHTGLFIQRMIGGDLEIRKLINPNSKALH
jgi:hypothetical protein